MKKIILFLYIYFIKFYKYFISPFFGNSCRYLPSCSEYYINSLKIHGIIKGTIMGIKRIFRCHPFKRLGGGSGLDLVPNRNNFKKGKFNG